MRSALRLLWVVVLVFLVPSGVGSQEPAKDPEQKPLRVAISSFHPFVFMEKDAPSGFSIELWETVARELKSDFRFVRLPDVTAKLAALREGRADVAIGGITMTKERESTLDFTHPTFHTGLDILVRSEGSVAWSAFKSFFTPGKVSIIIGFLLLIIIAGHVMWFAERGKPAFSDRYVPGVFEGMYWAVVTASTVGYGDKVPVKWFGRIVACVIIVIALPLFAVFTATVASTFTVQSLQGTIQGPEDLRGKRVGVVKGTASATHVGSYQPIPVEFGDINQACDALLNKRVDAVVYDAPNLRYFVQKQGQGRVNVVGRMFVRQRYAIALLEGAALRERLNRALLTLNESGELGRLRQKWFGGER
jgi:polar amino acid transport system substrate-binding protein